MCFLGNKGKERAEEAQDTSANPVAFRVTNNTPENISRSPASPLPAPVGRSHAPVPPRDLNNHPASDNYSEYPELVPKKNPFLVSRHRATLNPLPLLHRITKPPMSEEMTGLGLVEDFTKHVVATYTHTELLNLPNDILGEIINRVIPFRPYSRISLLLSCKRLYKMTLASQASAARQHAIETDAIGALLFEPSANCDLYWEWMPQIVSRATQIQQLLELVQPQNGHLSSYTGPCQRVLRRIFKLGLYLISIVHFNQLPDLSTAQVDSFVDALPHAGLLILRVTSVIMAVIFRSKFGSTSMETQIRRSAMEGGFVVHFQYVAWAFEKLLLSSGLRWPVWELDHFDIKEWDRWTAEPRAGELVLRLAAIIRQIDYCAALGEEHALAIRIMKVMFFARVEERIEDAYPGEEMLGDLDVAILTPMQTPMVERLQEWMVGRGDLELLLELKAAIAG